MTPAYAYLKPKPNQRSSGVVLSLRMDSCERCTQAHAPQSIVQRPGLPLNPATRAAMENRFGHSFTNVRVHSDEVSAASARGLKALAYSLGPHIVFGSGQYTPETSAGERLLAHELAHVVQQDDAQMGDPCVPTTNMEGTTLEDEANRAADSAVGGHDTVVRRGVTSSTGLPLRQASPTEAGPAPPASRKPLREQRFNVGRGGHRMDAELDRSIGWLTVKVKVKFNPVNTPERWPSPAHFARFQSELVDTVSSRWSFKHYLVPEETCPDEPPLVVVRLQIVPVTSGQHFTANVAYVTSTEPQSSVGGRTASLDVLDVKRRSDIPQTPAEHETGHMLGLSHVDCDANKDECYGKTREGRADIMGKGSFVSPRDYQPFADLMTDFTGCNYRVRQASQIPTSRAPGIGGAIGFLLGGVGLGSVGAAIGSMLGPVGALIGGLVGLIGGAVGGYFAGRAIAEPTIPS